MIAMRSCAPPWQHKIIIKNAIRTDGVFAAKGDADIFPEGEAYDFLRYLTKKHTDFCKKTKKGIDKLWAGGYDMQ